MVINITDWRQMFEENANDLMPSIYESYAKLIQNLSYLVWKEQQTRTVTCSRHAFSPLRSQGLVARRKWYFRRTFTRNIRGLKFSSRSTKPICQISAVLLPASTASSRRVI